MSSKPMPSPSSTSDEPMGKELEVKARLGSIDSSSGPIWQAGFLALIVLAALLLGAGKTTWSLGAVSALLGVGMLFAPPQVRLPRVAAWSLLLFGLAPLVGLLPVSWVGESVWRKDLWLNWGIAVPRTVSPDPRATFESWMVVAVGVLWLWTCLGQRFSREGRRLAIYTLALGGVVIAALSLADFYAMTIPWWPRNVTAWGLASFGPFSNRNHTSSINAICCVLCAASAYDAYRKRSHLWWVFALVFWVPLAAIFVNTSRGGLILVFGGLVVWVTTAAMHKGFTRKISVGLALMIVTCSVLLVSPGQLGTRIRALTLEQKVSPLTAGLRGDLARETLALSTQHPWLGQGFDTFGTVFPMLTHLDYASSRFQHPESDLLLLLYEGGLLALVPCLVLLGWILFNVLVPDEASRRGQKKERGGRQLRKAAAIGAGMALVHSFFDVPNHGLGYAMQTSLLLGLALSWPEGKLAGRLQPWVFRGLSLAAMMAGSVWLAIGFKKWLPPIPSSVAELREQALKESGEGRPREALKQMDRALWISPLDFRLYYLRAQLLLQLRQRPERALEDFGRSRALEPHYADNCLKEGHYWLGYAPDFAIIPWRECLRRHPRDSGPVVWHYNEMLSRSESYAPLRAPMWLLAENPEMQITFLAHTPAAEWPHYLGLFLASQPHLDRLDPGLLRWLFRLWDERGDRHALTRLFEENPTLQTYGWRTMARELALQGRYDAAVQLAAKFFKRPDKPSWLLGSDISRLERAFVLNPADVRPGVELYYAQRTAGDLKAARVTAEKVIALPDAPSFMILELAMLYAELQDHRRAWETMEQAMRVMQEG